MNPFFVAETAHGKLFGKLISFALDKWVIFPRRANGKPYLEMVNREMSAAPSTLPLAGLFSAPVLCVKRGGNGYPSPPRGVLR